MPDLPPRARTWAPTLAGWLVGNALHLQQTALWTAATYAGMAVTAVMATAVTAAAIAVCRARRRRPLVSPWQQAAFALVLAFSVGGLRATAFQSHALDPALEGRDLLLTGTIADMPQFLADGARFRLEPESATQDGLPVAVPPLIELGWWNDGDGESDAADTLPVLRAGERWRFTVRLKAPHGNRNPHGFDYELRAWEQGVQALGSVRRNRRTEAPRRLDAAGWNHPVEQARQRVRDAIVQRLAIPKAGAGARGTARQRAAGVVAALVTGDQRAIGRADWEVFRATGTAHLMSISGLHVTLFAWLAGWAVGALWRRSARLCLAWPAPQAALLGGVVSAGLYAWFSGGGIPSQRTVLMLAIVAALRFSGRRWPWPHAWLLAAAGAVALDPWAWLQAGFWLSFVAVGVLFAGGTAPPPPDGRWRRVLSKSAGMLREQLVVTLALAPLTLLLFGLVSLVGLPANLLAIPWSTLVITPLALLGVLAPPLWDLAALAVGLLGLALDWLAASPYATLALPVAPAWVTAAAVAGGALLCMRLPPVLRLLGVAPLVVALLWSPPRPPSGTFELLAMDVGQGSSILVRTAGHALLYDTGPRYSAESDAGQRVVVPLLQAEGIRLDTVVLSHRDSDHVGGAVAVLSQQPQAGLLASIEPDHPLQALRTARRCEAGQSWTWDGVRFEILSPQAADYAANLESNALSCVLRIEAGGTAALLTGDIGDATEARLLGSGARLSADWLLVPHHGSRGSSGAAFLQSVAPHIALAQAGYRNRYGHPSPQAQARYAQQGIPWLDTVHCGAQRWTSEHPHDFVCERYRDRHYWQHNVP